MNSNRDRELDLEFQIPDNQTINSKYYGELSNQALSTSYSDYLKIFQQLSPQQCIVDLGAGFCRGTLIAGKLGLPLRCISVEVEEQRLAPAGRLAAAEDLIHADLFHPEFELPQETDAVFIYLPAGLLLARITQLLQRLRKRVEVFAIESHGQLVPSLDLLGCFEDKSVIGNTTDSRHDDQIYRYVFNPRAQSQALELAQVGLSGEAELRIASPEGIWVAHAEGLELSVYKEQAFLETKVPRRMLALEGLSYQLAPRSHFLDLYSEPGVTKIYCRPPKAEMIDGSVRQI